MFRLILLTTCCILIISCQDAKDIQDISTDPPLFTLLPSDQTKIDFKNDIEDREDQNIAVYDYFYNGGGVAIGDIDNDGLPDLLFTGNQVENKLYKNLGNWQFQDITFDAGVGEPGFWSTGATFVDINNDGWLDIYICHSGLESAYPNRQNHLYINNQNGSFEERSAQYGLKDNNYSTQAAFFDYDTDGDLDLFVMNHTDFVNRFKQTPGFLNRQQKIEEYIKTESNRIKSSNLLFENIGGNKFVDATKSAGLRDWGYGLGLTVSDLNKDGLPDIYVANDFFVPDFIYYNNGDKTFSEVNKSNFGHNSQFSMGCDVADINDDGWLDVFVVDMTSNDRVRNKTLMRPMDARKFIQITKHFQYQHQYMFNVVQLNNGNGHFSEIGQLIGIAQTDWSWATLLADFDLDGKKDNYITNGYKRDTKNRDIIAEVNALNKERGYSDMSENLKKYPSVPLSNFMFKNNGEFQFHDVSDQWGLGHASFSNGAAYGDLDNDGDLDLVINNIDSEAFVYQNNGSDHEKRNQITLQFDYNPANYNAKVESYSGAHYQFYEFHPVRGYMSSMDHILILGLGEKLQADSIVITRLNGERALIQNVPTNQKLEIAALSFTPSEKEQKQVSPLFSGVDNNSLGIDSAHKDNLYWDFSTEVLLPHKQSTNGPHVAVGDINGDSLEDFIIGGGQNQHGYTFIQRIDGSFDQFPNDHQRFEDIGLVLFDYDGDGDKDLYAVSGGGGDVVRYPRLLQDRIYTNNGNGQFSFEENVLPQMPISGSRVKPYDFDNDGDLDLFIGGRVVPGKYPQTPKSVLLLNENGKFRNVTDEIATDLEFIGMVTDFQWVDINNDNNVDLILAGEWMNIEIFLQQNGRFERATEKYFPESTRGWWFSVHAADFDNDGDVDLVAGNLGLNNKFHASSKKPLDIYFNDFDENGVFDIVLAKTNDEGEQFPLRGKDCSTEQMPFIKDKFPKYEDFALASINDVFDEDKIKTAIHYSISDFSSAYFKNENGTFVRYALPIMAQTAPINDVLIEDFDKDGHLDIVVAGNLFDTEVETARYDAGTGVFLKGDGTGRFTAESVTQSGLFLNKNLRDLDLIRIKGQTHILAANNNDVIELVRVNNSVVQ